MTYEADFEVGFEAYPKVCVVVGRVEFDFFEVEVLCACCGVLKMTTLLEIFVSKATDPALRILVGNFFAQPAVKEFLAAKNADYNRIYLMLKDYLMADEHYSQSKSLLEGLVKIALNPQTKIRKRQKKDDDEESDEDTSPKSTTRAFRDKLTKLENLIVDRTKELAKALKTATAKAKDEDYYDVYECETVRGLLTTLSVLYHEEAEMVDQVIGDGSSFAYRRRLDEIESFLVAIDSECRRLVRERKIADAAPYDPESIVVTRVEKSPAKSDNSPNDFLLFCRSRDNSPKKSDSPTADRSEASSNSQKSPMPVGLPFKHMLSDSRMDNKRQKKTYVKRTSIRVDFLRRHRPTWFTSNINYRDSNTFNRVFADLEEIQRALRDIDALELIKEVCDLKMTRPETFDEVCALLAMVQEKKEKTKHSFLEGDDDDEEDDNFYQRKVILVDCVRQLLSSSTSTTP